jgi:extradiol dioxygenase family protein
VAVELNHLIVNVKDKRETAKFYTEVFGLPEAVPFAGHFLVVKLANGVSMDLIDSPEPIESMHYAFLVSDREFDAIFGRIQERNMTFWADPGRRSPGRINDYGGGRGVYFCDPSGHFLEIITKPYPVD